MEQSNQNIRPNIFEYDDYRKYLGEMYAFFKSQSKHFSYRYFAKRAGFTSPNFLKLVIEGKRNISIESAGRFCVAFKLSKSESEFLQSLVNFNQAENLTEKASSAKALLQQKSYAKIHPLTQAQFSYYSNWYYIPLREMVALKSFKEDPHYLSEQFQGNVSPAEVIKALKDLENLGLLSRASDGSIHQSQKTLNTANEVSSAAIVQYHKEMMKLAANSLDTVEKSKREISAACIPVSAETIERIKNRLQEFRQEILAIASEDQNPDVIYQLNFQMFPIGGGES